ncbi:MAG: [LysW]-lysine hydrolase [Ardenticatenaceae bacterium]
MNSVELLQRMVDIRSLSGEEEELAEFLAGVMGELGFEARVDEAGNAVGVRQRGSDEEIRRELVLLGHMDTVPGKIPVRIEDGEGEGEDEGEDEGGLLYGRGTVDAKGPLATFIMATAQAELPLGTRVIVVGAVEEECATSKGARHVAKLYKPDACIIGEPSNWDAVTLGYKGRLLIDYRLEQEMSHTAGPQGAVAERAIEWWQAVREYSETFNFNEGQVRKRLFDKILPSLRRINTDSDGIHDSVKMTVGLRLPLDFDVEAFQATFRQAAGDATLDFYSYEPAFRGPRTTPLVRAFQRAIRKQGARARFKVKTGTSDMNVVGPVWQCPILAYGPGDSQLDHTPHEHIEIAEYLKAIDVLQHVLEM